MEILHLFPESLRWSEFAAVIRKNQTVASNRPANHFGMPSSELAMKTIAFCEKKMAATPSNKKSDDAEDNVVSIF